MVLNQENNRHPHDDVVKRHCSALLCLVLSAFLSPVPTAFSADSAQVKAAMALNIAKFVDWPAEAFSSAASPFVICVVGKGPFAAAIESLKGKSIKNRHVVVRAISQNTAAEACQMLVVTDTGKHRLPPVADSIANDPVLTVSDLSGFAQGGGIAGLVEEGGKVRLEINQEAGRKAGLKISATLLKLARIVRGAEQ